MLKPESDKYQGIAKMLRERHTFAAIRRQWKASNDTIAAIGKAEDIKPALPGPRPQAGIVWTNPERVRALAMQSNKCELCGEAIGLVGVEFFMVPDAVKRFDGNRGYFAICAVCRERYDWAWKAEGKVLDNLVRKLQDRLPALREYEGIGPGIEIDGKWCAILAPVPNDGTYWAMHWQTNLPIQISEADVDKEFAKIGIT